MSVRNRYGMKCHRDASGVEASPIEAKKLLRYEIWAAAIAVGGTVYSADQQRKAGKDAARGAQAGADLSQAQYELQRQDRLPYMESGRNALAQLDRLNAGDYSGFTQSPDYQFALEQGIKGVDRSASARGTQFSGGQLASLANYTTGLASQNYGNYYNRISQLAGLGQNAAAGVGNAGMQYAGQAGGYMADAANAGAMARIGAASTYGDLGEQLSGAFGRWQQGRDQSRSGYGGQGSGMGMYRPQPFDPWNTGGRMNG